MYLITVTLQHFASVSLQWYTSVEALPCATSPFVHRPLPNKYYHTENDDENPFICSQQKDNGMRVCSSVPKMFEEGGVQCNLDMYSNVTDNTTCINWNQYYNNCSDGMVNPFKGAINFDNIFYAWIAIFQVTRHSLARAGSSPGHGFGGPLVTFVFKVHIARFQRKTKSALQWEFFKERL